MPFVNFKQYITQDINNTPTLIFGSEFNCILDSIILSNKTNSKIIASLYILREVDKDKATECTLANKIVIEPNSLLDILESATLTLEAGDLLYAYSDFSENVFNSFISYRELIELGGENDRAKDGSRKAS